MLENIIYHKMIMEHIKMQDDCVFTVFVFVSTIRTGCNEEYQDIIVMRGIFIKININAFSCFLWVNFVRFLVFRCELSWFKMLKMVIEILDYSRTTLSLMVRLENIFKFYSSNPFLQPYRALFDIHV